MKHGIFALALLSVVTSAYAGEFTSSVYEIGSGRKHLLFTYHVIETPRRIETSYRPAGQPEVEAVHETVEFDDAENHRIHSYSTKNSQLESTSHLEVKGKSIFFTYTRGGKTKNDDEDLPENLIVPPTTGDFMERHWKEILKGDSVDARVAVMARAETVGFTFHKVKEESLNGKKVVIVKMKPTSIFISALVDPLIFTCDATSGTVIAFTGRTLPRVLIDGKWRDLDAETVINKN